MFTRDVEQPRPHCFGFNSGWDNLEPGNFLYSTLALMCGDCRHFAGCCDETDQSFTED